MDLFYYILGGIVVYFASDWILNRIEQVRGKCFAERSVVFFFILLVLAALMMNIFGPLLQSSPPPPETSAPAR